MTVSTTESIAEFVSGGPNFPIDYRFLRNEDLVVTLSKPDQTTETLVLGTQYTLAGADLAQGGTLTSAYASGVLGAGGATLAISRVMVATQETDLRNQGRYLAETQERVMDRLTMLIQQALALLGRALVRPPGKSNYDAQNRRIINLADPVNAQDAATRNWAQQFIASILATGQGPLNNAANVVYIGPDNLPYTLQDLANKIDKTKGAALVGFVSDFTGAVGRTLYSKIAQVKDIEDFGAVGDWNGTTGTDDTAAFQAARDWAFNRLPAPSEIRFSRRYKITASPNWSVSGLTMSTIGMPEIKCTGGSAASALLIDGQALVSGKSYYGMTIGNFLLTGNSSTLAVFKTTNMSHSKFGKIRAREADPSLGAAFYVGWGVCNTYELLTCSTNEDTMTSKPLRGLYITSSAGLATTDCTFNQIIMEGTTVGTAIAAGGGEFNSFLGGTTENCSGTGFQIGAGNKGNNLKNMAFEANVTDDILDQGSQTLIEGGYSTKRVNFVSALNSRIKNMYTQRIEIDSSSARIRVEDVIVSRFAAGGGLFDFATVANRTTKSGVWNENTGVFDVLPVVTRNPTSALASITVGASPFTYTNNTSYEECLIVRGSGVTQVQLVRGGAPTLVGGGGSGMTPQNIYRCLPGDALIIAYSGTAELIRVPM